VINVASVAGQMGGVAVGVHYVASKGGLLALTKAFARILAPYSVTVNAIAPSTVETDLVAGWSEQVREDIRGQLPLGRFIQPEEIAEAAAYLCSPAAGAITGATIDVNRGLLMR
jgi:3-oxoacyl-[acyl-carrier protein] reductase